ncbi:MAG TPA: hypothetical protein VNB64_09995 [Solirubrobacteraceae bacterium]|nr:hypothetical protein [Solirubrobacteraceae bacterium]
MAGLFVALVLSVIRGTRLRDEAAELPLYGGLLVTAVYVAILLWGLL